MRAPHPRGLRPGERRKDTQKWGAWAKCNCPIATRRIIRVYRRVTRPKEALLAQKQECSHEPADEDACANGGNQHNGTLLLPRLLSLGTELTLPEGFFSLKLGALLLHINHVLALGADELLRWILYSTGWTVDMFLWGAEVCAAIAADQYPFRRVPEISRPARRTANSLKTHSISPLSSLSTVVYSHSKWASNGMCVWMRINPQRGRCFIRFHTDSGSVSISVENG